jgi:hypothetical protein
MGLKAIARLAPVLVQYRTSAGEAADVHIFVADRDYEIMDVRGRREQQHPGCGCLGVWHSSCESHHRPEFGVCPRFDGRHPRPGDVDLDGSEPAHQ